MSIGAPAGIGPDLALMAYHHHLRTALPAFFVIAPPELLRERAERLALDVPLAEITRPSEAEEAARSGLPVLPLKGMSDYSPGMLEPGRPSAEHAAMTLASLDAAIELALEGAASGVVTNPIHKASLYEAGFRHAGHTEYLGEVASTRTGQPCKTVMMLANDYLKVVPVTVHIAISDVASVLSTDLIVETAEITATALARDFGIETPVLAISGLNPHAGENGALGREEIEIIAPAIEVLKTKGRSVIGPLPGDTMFHAEARSRYDAALCMYHDQALIPLKALDFFGGVNITLGLPFIRTSPDHGTAFDLAGTGGANPASLIAAIRKAAEMAEARASKSA